jgi:hypothetical protein
MRLLGCCGRNGGSNAVDVVVLLNFIAALREVGQGSAVFWVDCVPYIGGHLPEEENFLYVIQRVRSLGSELVHENEWLICSQAGVIQPSGGSLAGVEAVGSQKDGLQLGVWVGDGGGVVAERAYDVYQREWELRNHPVELGERSRDAAGGEGRVDLAKPGLGGVHVVVREPDSGGDKVCIVAPAFHR